jgi:hypothetical protein
LSKKGSVGISGTDVRVEVRLSPDSDRIADMAG